MRGPERQYRRYFLSTVTYRSYFLSIVVGGSFTSNSALLTSIRFGARDGARFGRRASVIDKEPAAAAAIAVSGPVGDAAFPTSHGQGGAARRAKFASFTVL